MKKRYSARWAFALLAAVPAVLADGLDTEFLTPPDAARPGVYWTIQDGNQDRDEMVADMDALHEVGYGSIIFMEVDRGIPRGPIPFMSAQWQDNIANTFVHAGNLGMEVILMTGPGWTGSGGPWTLIADSMKHLVGSSLQVTGPGTLNQVLPVPPPHPANPFAGMNGTQAAERAAWFDDVAVLAFPTPSAGTATIGTANTDLVNIKTLKGVLPYSIRQTNNRFVLSQASYPEPGTNQIIDDSRVVDLSSLLQPDGRINWTIPAGNWTVMRFVARSTGQTSRPAPLGGFGYENDKFDGATYRRHWDNFQKPLLEKIVAQGGPLQPGRGITTIHLDSWEMSAQNWTAAFRQEFQIRRGYDPQPFFPAWMGLVVGSREETERFLWDMRKTSQELVLEEYAGEIKQVAHENGLLYSNQPYDMNPAGDIDLASVSDIPSCEFWNDTVNTQYGCIEAVSVSHTMGPQLVRAEAFTSAVNSFDKNPANMKNQTDWAFAIGINGLITHGSAHQPLGDGAKPGMTFGENGLNLSRHQTFWDYLPDFNRYLARCSHVLRQGEAVADILYLAPEAAPYIFEAPADATEGPGTMRDKRGYSFDAVTPRILSMRAVVEGDRIAFPDGSKYRILVLPGVSTMTPETLSKIDELVQAGATVIGNPPVESPSLVNYPTCDSAVSTLATTMWGGTVAPGTVTAVSRGSGTIYWGGNLNPPAGGYPSYAATAPVLAELGLVEDFTSPSGKLRYLHRVTADRHIYFVSNRSAENVVTEGVFRIDGLAPELWNPHTGEIRSLEDYSSSGGVTTVPLSFEPAQSFFVVFPHSSSGSTPPASPEDNFPTYTPTKQLDGAWEVAFDPTLGGPASVSFDSLVDWTQRPELGIRYYSGVATYTKSFDVPQFDPEGGNEFFLNVGAINGLCEVRLNGQDLGVAWTAPWRVNITPALQSTGNQLEIDVVNNWANRLIGDQQPADANVRTLSWPSGLLGGGSVSAGRYTYVTNSVWNAASPLQSAGLIGPVSVLTSGPDTFAPTSTNLLPADDTTTLFMPSSLVMTFNESLVRGTGSITIKNLSDSSQTAIDVTDGTQVSVAGRALTLTPTGAFLADKNYAIRIDVGAITDAAGNPFAGLTDDTSWNFTTSATSAQVIVQDGFSGAFVGGNGAITGRNPDTINLPGNSYTEQQNANVQARMELDTSTGFPGNSLKTGFNNSAHIQYSNSGTPTVPITLSIDAQINTLAEDTAPRGIGLGFWSPLPSLYPGTEVYATAHFTGILVNPSGTLEYVRNGASQGIFTAAPGGFSAAAFHNLTYTVDPVTSSILHLEYAGTNYTADFVSSFPANFTPSDNAGLLGSTASNASFFGRVDNFIVATTSVTSPLLLGSLSPADGSTGVAGDSNLVAIFNKQVVAGSGNITLKRTSDNFTVESFDVPSSPRLTFSGTTLTINPTSDLAAGTGYHVLIDSTAIKDPAADPFAGIGDSTTWNFTIATSRSRPINVNNHSFETDVWLPAGTAGFLHTGWTATGQPGTANTTAAQFPAPGLPDGVNYGWTNKVADALIQVLADDLAADTIYTLTVATGWRADLPGAGYPTYPGYGIELWAGGVKVASDYYTDAGNSGPVRGTWKEVTATYTSPSSVTPGQALEIRLIGYGVQTNYDDVRLTADMLTSPNDFDAYISDPAFGLDPAERGFDQDPDGDRIPNGLEAWFGTHPGEFTAGLADLTTDGTTTTFTHPQNEAPPSDLSGYYEWSPSLSDWYASGSGPGGGPTVTLIPNTVGTSTTVTATASEGLSRLFLRAGVRKD